MSLAGACSGRPAPGAAALANDADPDPYVSLCEGMLHPMVQERPWPPDVALIMGWTARVVAAEHAGGDDQGARHVVSLVYEASTHPPYLPIRDRMTCEYPSDPDWWRGGKRRRKNVVCSRMAVHLLPDRITADGKEIRYARPRDRTRIEAWADKAKEHICVYGHYGPWPAASLWTAKDAYRACGPMLKALGTEESNPPGCSALHMCANEAPLDDAEMAELYKLIERTPGCEPP
jgi:hypothetical protein